MHTEKKAEETSILQKPMVISVNAQAYHGWPTIAKTKSGILVLGYSGGRQAHVCPFGRIEFMVSRDGGSSWSWPRVVADGPIDDRDTGILGLSNGTLVLTYFTSLAYEDVCDPKIRDDFHLKHLTPEDMALWPLAEKRISDTEKNDELGSWLIKSLDGGKTWSSRCRTPVSSPHGPIELSDGRLLYVGTSSKNSPEAWQSHDSGDTWEKLSSIPVGEGHDRQLYTELHAVETGSGTLIVHIRYDVNNPQGDATPDLIETLQTESHDGGHTWSQPHSTGYYGYPSHLLRLKNDDLMVSYGHRISPFGIQARISKDNGMTWPFVYTLIDDAASHDIGYPSTVERDDGIFVTVWYEGLKTVPKAVLRQITWSIREIKK